MIDSHDHFVALWLSCAYFAWQCFCPLIGKGCRPLTINRTNQTVLIIKLRCAV